MTFGPIVAERRVEAPDGAPTEGVGAGSEKTFFTIKEAGQYADVWLSVDRSRETVLFAYDYSLRSRSASCRLTTYWRKRGATRLEVQRARSSFELHLPPTAGGTEDYQVVFRRDSECDRMSQTFMLGKIDWDAPNGAVQTAWIFEGSTAADERGFIGVAQKAGLRVSKFFDCSLFAKSHAARCAKPEYIEIEQATE